MNYDIHRRSIDIRPLVFLDRDGVVNRKLPGDRFVCDWSEFEFLPGVHEAIRMLNQTAIRTILVTNQRGISLGLYTEVDLQRLHAQMTSSLTARGAKIDGIYYCPHSKDDCSCRKPGTALFEQAFQDFPGTTPSNSILVGDSASDMEAAQRLGCRKVLVAKSFDYRICEKGVQVEFFSGSLLDAVKCYIIPQLTGRTPE